VGLIEDEKYELLSDGSYPLSPGGGKEGCACSRGQGFLIRVNFFSVLCFTCLVSGGMLSVGSLSVGSGLMGMGFRLLYCCLVPNKTHRNEGWSAYVSVVTCATSPTIVEDGLLKAPLADSASGNLITDYPFVLPLAVYPQYGRFVE